jgi:hypothetical protein
MEWDERVLFAVDSLRCKNRFGLIEPDWTGLDRLLGRFVTRVVNVGAM